MEIQLLKNSLRIIHEGFENFKTNKPFSWKFFENNNNNDKIFSVSDKIQSRIKVVL